MTKRNRTQEYHATFEEQASTLIQIIAFAEEFQKALAGTKSKEACESSILEEINECTSQIVSLFTYQTKPQEYLYKIDIQVLNAKRNMSSFWDQKRKSRKAVFFNQHRNARLNEILSGELKK